jgi:membrane associated rhomboid family serine protease
MHQASVGFHCPECTRASGQKVIRASQLRAASHVVTHVLIGLNLAVFVAGMGSGLSTRDEFIGRGGLVGEGLLFQGIPIDAGAAARFGAPIGEVVGVAHGEWWRLVSSGFLHANLIHIGFNMWVLYQLGQLLEPALGRLRFGLVYVVALLGGGFGVLLLDPDAFTVGASGAVFGLMGAAVAAFRARGINPFDTGLGGAVLLNLAFTFAIPGISIGGHVGGLVAGFAAGWLLLDAGPRHLRDARATLAAVVVLGAALATGAVLVAAV